MCLRFIQYLFIRYYHIERHLEGKKIHAAVECVAWLLRLCAKVSSVDHICVRRQAPSPPDLRSSNRLLSRPKLPIQGCIIKPEYFSSCRDSSWNVENDLGPEQFFCAIIEPIRRHVWLLADVNYSACTDGVLDAGLIAGIVQMYILLVGPTCCVARHGRVFKVKINRIHMYITNAHRICVLYHAKVYL